MPRLIFPAALWLNTPKTHCKEGKSYPLNIAIVKCNESSKWGKYVFQLVKVQLVLQVVKFEALNTRCIVVLSVPIFVLLTGAFWRNLKDKECAILTWNIIENSIKSHELWWRNLWGFLQGKTFNSSLTENILQPHPTQTHQVENPVLAIKLALIF